MKLSRNRLLAAVAVLLVAGVAIAGYLLATDDDDDADDADDVAFDSSSTTDLGGQGSELTTSTTIESSTSSTSSTSNPVATTSTTVATTTTTTAAGGTTTTTRPPTGVCGTGTARVTISARDLATTPTESAFVPEARVENTINRPIEVDLLAADVTFADGSSRQVTFQTAGVVIAPNTTATYTSDRIVTPTQYTSARVSSFAYFTSGQRERCRVSL